MKEREVIVVGAGPAGATTAMALAQQGRDVLLLDRQQFPRDKTCGDAVPAGAIELLYDLGMRQKIESAGFYPVRKLLISALNGSVLEAEFRESPLGAESYVIPRLQFDVTLQQHAVASGAEFVRAQVKEPIIENGQVVGVLARRNGKTEELRSRVVVGADGATSVITRALRPEENRHVDKHRAVALRAYVEDLEELPHEIEFYLYKGIVPGYAWIFPIGEGKANVGLGMRLDIFRRQKRDLHEMLQIFLEMPAIKKRLKHGGQLRDVATWSLNFGSQKNLKHVYNGAMLVGDAAGFINPLTGGGIHNAIISGKFAAETIETALRQGNISAAALKIYEQRCHEEMWAGMRRSFFFQRLMGQFPFIVDILVSRMNANSQFAEAFLTKI